VLNDSPPDRGDCRTDLTVVQPEPRVPAHPVVGIHDHFQDILLNVIDDVFIGSERISVPLSFLFFAFTQQIGKDTPCQTIRGFSETDTIGSFQLTGRVLCLRRCVDGHHGHGVERGKVKYHNVLPDAATRFKYGSPFKLLGCGKSFGGEHIAAMRFPQHEDIDDTG